MSKPSVRWTVTLLFLLFAAPIGAADRTAPELLPATTVVYFELQKPADLVKFVVDHPLSQRIQSTNEYQKATETKQYLQWKAGVAAVEAQMSMPWRKTIESIGAGGIYLGIDGQSQGAATLIRGNDPGTLQSLVQTLTQLARLDATSKGNPDPIKTAEYRGVHAYEAGPVIVALHENWLIICNKSELGKSIIDRLMDGGASLADENGFQSARKGQSPDDMLWGFVDVARFRNAGIGKDIFRGPVDNPVAELLLGGAFATLQKTPYATVHGHVGDQGIRLALAMPHDKSWVSDAREYFFGPDGTGRAPAPLKVANELFSLRSYRDISGMWRRAGDLFNAKINDDFAKADSQLATLFSGKDFGEDILGALQPEIHLVAVRQSFDDAKNTPAIKLPAFALAARLKDAAKMQPELRRIFQSLVGFLNIVGAMNGQPQMELDIDKRDGKQVLSANYLADAGDKPTTPGKINYNFSPSVAFSGDWFVVSSTKNLASELADSVSAQVEREAGAVNSAVRIQFSTLRQLLDDNRQQLVSQNMLQKGHTKEQADHEIGLLLELLGFGQDTRFTLTAERELRLELQTTLKDGAVK